MGGSPSHVPGTSSLYNSARRRRRTQETLRIFTGSSMPVYDTDNSKITNNVTPDYRHSTSPSPGALTPSSKRCCAVPVVIIGLTTAVARGHEIVRSLHTTAVYLVPGSGKAVAAELCLSGQRYAKKQNKTSHTAVRECCGHWILI